MHLHIYLQILLAQPMALAALGADMGACIQAHDDALKDCATQTAQAKANSDAASRTALSNCMASGKSISDCGTNLSNAGGTTSQALGKGINACQNDRNSCDTSCDPSNFSFDEAFSNTASINRNDCDTKIDSAMNQMAQGQPGAIQAQQGGKATSAAAGSGAGKGLNLMSLLPAAAALAGLAAGSGSGAGSTPQPPVLPPPGSYSTASINSGCTPATAGTAAGGPGCLDKVLSDGTCTSAGSGSNPGCDGFRAVAADQCKTAPGSKFCLDYRTASVCQQLSESGGSLPPECGGSVAAAASGSSIKTAGVNNSAGGISSGSGGAMGMPGAGGATLADGKAATDKQKVANGANREGLSLAVDGGGGGGVSSGEGSDGDHLNFSMQNRAPAGAKTGGLAVASAASDIGPGGGHSVSIIQLVGEVYMKRCLAGKFLHCGPNAN
jgi:hypothetical protein